MATAGRKKAVIDWDRVDQSLIAGATGTKIAAQLGICPDTLYIHCKEEKKMDFSAYAQQKRDQGDVLLLVAQFDEAVRKRDRGMLIWLGKNRLSQSNKETVEHQGGVPIQIVNYSEQGIQPWKEDKKDGDAAVDKQSDS